MSEKRRRRRGRKRAREQDMQEDVRDKDNEPEKDREIPHKMGYLDVWESKDSVRNSWHDKGMGRSEMSTIGVV